MCGIELKESEGNGWTVDLPAAHGPPWPAGRPDGPLTERSLRGRCDRYAVTVDGGLGDGTPRGAAPGS
jgi:hypothetical protein